MAAPPGAWHGLVPYVSQNLQPSSMAKEQWPVEPYQQPPLSGLGCLKGEWLDG